ncbi:hypothetical protein EG68_03055 [Paragonimus skrjabini miyazakii]|uniref:Microtubule-associated protein 9 n=1 Tax=Paragonimus skrjabini miyazakii TaxID=59628 RepID=A0A8S9Z136_9TREM|nr:hypothetical protein EG68_03055 [Paragonimus skrjabini miyazakii]
MPVSPLDILGDDSFDSLLTDASRKKKKKGRRKGRDIFAELGLNDDLDDPQLNGASFLKPNLATNAVKTVKFSERVDIKESTSSEPTYEDRENRLDDGNQSAFSECFEGHPLDSLPSSDANYSSYTETENFCDRNQENASFVDFGNSFHHFNKMEGDTKAGGKKESTDSSITNDFISMTESATELHHKAREDVKQEAEIKQQQETMTAKNVVKAHSREKSPQRNPLTSKKPPVAAIRKRSNSFNAIILEARQNGHDVHSVILTAKEQSELATQREKTDVAVISNQNRTIPRSSSCQNIRRECLSPATQIELPANGVTDAATLRMLAYRNWYARRAKSARDNCLSSLRKDVEESKNKREEFEKLQSNDKAFVSWKSQKRAYFREQIRKKKEEEELRRKKNEELDERKKSSGKAFEVWKSKKDVVVSKQLREKKEKEQELVANTLKEEEEKRKNSEKAFLAWKAKKEAEQREQHQDKKQKQTEQEKKREEEARIKLEKATEAYYQWEMRKLADMGYIILSRETRKTTSVENLRESVSKEHTLERVPWRPPSSRPSISRALQY